MNPKYQRALKFTCIYQFLYGLLMTMNLDGGQLLAYWAIALFAYTVSVLMIISRKQHIKSKTALCYFQFGSLIVLAITPIIVNFVWSLQNKI